MLGSKKITVLLLAVLLIAVILYFVVFRNSKSSNIIKSSSSSGSVGSGGSISGGQVSTQGKGEAAEGYITVDSINISKFIKGYTVYSKGHGDWWKCKWGDSSDSCNEIVGYGAPSQGANCGIYVGTIGLYNKTVWFGVIDTKTGETGVSTHSSYKYFDPKQNNFYQIQKK